MADYVEYFMLNKQTYLINSLLTNMNPYVFKNRFTVSKCWAQLQLVCLKEHTPEP